MVEDWKNHRIVEPLLKEVLVDLGINAAFFPAEVGGTDIPDPHICVTVICEELARIDAGFCVAVVCSIWGMVPIIWKPHRDLELCEEFEPKIRGEKLYVDCHAMTEPNSGADIENVPSFDKS